MDHSHTRTLLRLNNIPDTASPTVIHDFLTQVHYTEKDIDEFIKERDAIATGKPLSKEIQNRNMPFIGDLRKDVDRRRSNPFVALLKFTVFTALLAAGGYTVYAAFIVPPEESVMGGAISLVGDKEYRIQFSMRSTATPNHGASVYAASADIDASDPADVRSEIGSSFESAEYTQNISLRLVGDKSYMQVKTLKIEDDYVPTNTAWYEIPTTVFEETNISGTPINPVVLFRFGMTNLAQSLATLFDVEAISNDGVPSVTIRSGRPVIVYTLAVDNKKVATLQDTGLQLQQMEFGPIQVTKDLITRKITSVEGTFTTMYKNDVGTPEPMSWEFQGNYYPISMLTIQTPKYPQPLSSFQSLINSNTLRTQ